MRIERSVDIEASPARVWAVLSDLPRWPEWTSTVKGFRWEQGDRLAVGARARLEIARAPAATWTVTEVSEGRSFTWQATMRGVTTVAGHEVEPAGIGSRVTLWIEQRGPGARLFRPLLAGVARRNLAIEGEGLRRRAETRQEGTPNG